MIHRLCKDSIYFAKGNMRSREFFYYTPPIPLSHYQKKILLITNSSLLIEKLRIFPYLCPIMRVARIRTRFDISNDNYLQIYRTYLYYAVSRQVFTRTD